MKDDKMPAAADRLSNAALADFGDAKDAAMALVAAAGNLLTDTFGLSGTGMLLFFADSYHAVVTANDELRREERGQQ